MLGRYNIMTITYELDLNSFEAWSGAKETLERIQREGKCEELENVLEELYPDGMTETELNDLLWFDSESVYEWLGIRSEGQIENEIEEAEADLEEKLSDLEFDLDDDLSGCFDNDTQREIELNNCGDKIIEWMKENMW